MRTKHVLSTILAVVAAAMLAGCDWYRRYKISSAIESARTKVEAWRSELRLPSAPETEQMGKRPGVELMLGPDSIRVHNVELIRRSVEQGHARQQTANAVKSHLDFRTDLDFDTDASKGLGDKKLREALDELRTHADVYREDIGADGKLEILLTFDERVTFRKVTEVLFSVGQADLSKYEILTEAPDSNNPPSSDHYERFGLATPTLCATPNTDQDPSRACVKPYLTRTANGIRLQLTNSVEWTDDQRCLTADKASDHQSAASSGETDSHDNSESDETHRDVRRVTDAPIRSLSGTCPIPADNDAHAAIKTLNHIESRTNLCNHGAVSAAYDISWGRIAPIIPALQRQTPVEFVSLSIPDQDARPCNEAVRPSNLFEP